MLRSPKMMYKWRQRTEYSKLAQTINCQNVRNCERRARKKTLHNICTFFGNKQKSVFFVVVAACANCVFQHNEENWKRNSAARNYFMGKFVLIAASFLIGHTLYMRQINRTFCMEEVFDAHTITEWIMVNMSFECFDCAHFICRRLDAQHYYSLFCL